MIAGKDQRRLNTLYEITRPSVGAAPTVWLVRRPGVTDFGATFGVAGQVQYLQGWDPVSRWDLDPWVVAREGSSNKVYSALSSFTFSTLTSDYYPRFYLTARLNIAGTSTDIAVVQFQNVATPAAAGNIRTFWTSTIGGWVEITDTDYTGMVHVGQMEQLDGYAIQGDSRGRIYQSGVNTFASWETNDYLTRTIAQDPAQGIMKARNQILFFGLETVEVFTNQGAPEGTVVTRVPFTTQYIGLSNVAGGGAGMTGKTHYYTSIGDLVFFVGRFGKGAYDSCLIAYDGRRFEKVSRPNEDKVLSSTTVYSVNKISFRGHIAVAIQLTPPTAATQHSLLFFPELNDWFEWESTVWSPVNNGRTHCGTTDPQKIYIWPVGDNWQDAGVAYNMVMQFRVPTPDISFFSLTNFGLIGDMSLTSQLIGVQTSGDDGQTWSASRSIDMAQLWTILPALGGFRRCMVRLTHAGSGEVRLRAAFMTVSK